MATSRSLCLSVALAVGLAACGGSSPDAGGGNGGDTSSSGASGGAHGGGGATGGSSTNGASSGSGATSASSTSTSTASSTSTSTASSSSVAATTTSASTGTGGSPPVPFRGTNYAGMEMGYQGHNDPFDEASGPVAGTDYPDYVAHPEYYTRDIDYFVTKNVHVFRLLFSWEGMQSTLMGPIPASNTGNYKHYFDVYAAMVAYATSKGIQVVVEPWEYGGTQDGSSGCGTAGCDTGALYRGQLIGSNAVPIAALRRHVVEDGHDVFGESARELWTRQRAELHVDHDVVVGGAGRGDGDPRDRLDAADLHPRRLLHGREQVMDQRELLRRRLARPPNVQTPTVG